MRAILLNGIKGRDAIDEIAKTNVGAEIHTNPVTKEKYATMFYLNTDTLVDISKEYKVDCISRDFSDRCWYASIYNGSKTEIVKYPFDSWTYPPHFLDFFSVETRDKLRKSLNYPTNNKQKKGLQAVYLQFVKEHPMTEAEQKAVFEKFLEEQTCHITLRFDPKKLEFSYE